MGQDTHHKQSRVRSTSTELGQERAGTSVPGHAGAQGTRAAPHGAGWSPGVGRRLSKSRRVARHQTGCCLLLLFAWKQHRTLLPTRTTQRGPSGTKGQRPTWLPCPASLSGCGVDGAEENPSQDIDFNFLRIKKKKPNQTDKKLPENSFLPHNFTEISLETSSARTCSRLCLSPPAQLPWHGQCQLQGSAPHPQHVPSAGHTQTPTSFCGSWKGSRRVWAAPVGS